MAYRKTAKGWYWGSKGPFPTLQKAQAVARAAYAGGYREDRESARTSGKRERLHLPGNTQSR